MDEFEMRDALKKQRQDIKSMDELVGFLRYVEESCNTGYGNAPRAIAQAALAVAHYFAWTFGITGFQAGFVMWDFILDWEYDGNKSGLKIVNFDDMLWPQKRYKFEKTISKTTFHKLQEQAKKLIEEKHEFGVHPDVLDHWQRIAAGFVPFGYTVEDR